MTTLPPPTEMYRALVDRDATYEGLFFVGVKTTGIFCRPTCTARKPKEENVEFFAGAREALHAGYRPCKRCRPMEGGHRPPEWVERLTDAVERAPTQRLTDADLRAMVIDPVRARRYFKRRYGMTFHAYHRARRMGLALTEVRRNGLRGNGQGNGQTDRKTDRTTDRLTDPGPARSRPRANGRDLHGVGLRHGFDSASGFRDAFARVFGAPPARATDRRCLQARWLETPLGPMIAIADDEGLALLEFVDRTGLENEIHALRKETEAAIVPGANAHLEQIDRELAEYFAGERTTFTVPLVIGGSVFQRRVWSKLLEIPPGETRSYADLARAVGQPGAPRAVGRANGTNRLAIVIPCHRVVRADGTLGGYGGGRWRKQRLLELENGTAVLPL